MNNDSEDDVDSLKKSIISLLGGGSDVSIKFWESSIENSQSSCVVQLHFKPAKSLSYEEYCGICSLVSRYYKDFGLSRENISIFVGKSAIRYDENRQSGSCASQGKLNTWTDYSQDVKDGIQKRSRLYERLSPNMPISQAQAGYYIPEGDDKESYELDFDSSFVDSDEPYKE